MSRALSSATTTSPHKPLKVPHEWYWMLLDSYFVCSISEVYLFQGENNMHLYKVGIWPGVLIKASSEVSFMRASTVVDIIFPAEAKSVSFQKQTWEWGWDEISSNHLSAWCGIMVSTMSCSLRPYLALFLQNWKRIWIIAVIRPPGENTNHAYCFAVDVSLVGGTASVLKTLSISKCCVYSD